MRFRGAVDEPRLVSQIPAAAPAVWVYHFRSTCWIFGLELLALVAFLQDAAHELAGCSIWCYMDSNNSLAAMPRGGSNTAVIAGLVARAWELIHRYHIRAWFSRVPSKLNQADFLTRGKAPPFPPTRRHGFRSISKLYRTCRSAARVQPQRAEPRIARLRSRYPTRTTRRK